MLLSGKRPKSSFIHTSLRTLPNEPTDNSLKKLAMWLVRYILIVSSMNESLHINLEQILMNLHGDRFKKIINITDKSLGSIKKDDDECGKYIW